MTSTALIAIAATQLRHSCGMGCGLRRIVQFTQILGNEEIVVTLSRQFLRSRLEAPSLFSWLFEDGDR